MQPDAGLGHVRLFGLCGLIARVIMHRGYSGYSGGSDFRK